jgi:hypothetical protein
MRLIAPLTTNLLATALFSTMVFATVAQSQSNPPESVLPKPFTATYEVSYRGMRAGSLTFKLSRDSATGRYTYETTANPSMLARIVVSSAALERSVMEIGPDGVRPVEWHLDDGKSGTAKDGKLTVDRKRAHRAAAGAGPAGSPVDPNRRRHVPVARRRAGHHPADRRQSGQAL